MTEYQHIMFRSLRDEIAFFNQQQLMILLFVTAIATALYVIAHHEKFRDCAQLIPFVIISGLFALGRADLLMHRAGAFIANFESTLSSSGWESFKNAQLATSVLPLYDILGLTIWIYEFWWAETQMFRRLVGRHRNVYILTTAGLAVLGASSIVFGAIQGYR